MLTIFKFYRIKEKRDCLLIVNFHKKNYSIQRDRSKRATTLFPNLRESVLNFKVSREYKPSVGGKLNQEHYLMYL